MQKNQTSTYLSDLISHAATMQQQAIATYSNFKVGASLRSIDGTFIGGFNIESVSYGLTMCAERVAIFSALTSGHKQFTHLALVTDHGVFPCGACRQLLYEFCNNASIIIATPQAIIATTTSIELMPHAFCNNDLEQSKKG
ncbi:MAG TPA: cytidine deaminase [Candidatus Saccharimonadales bacterium]|nr:cytidine deaminase [Candidatus Saccharimonadales bacterium]